MKRPLTLSVLALYLTVLLTSGCLRKDTELMKIDESVVSDADIVAIIDLASAKKTPLYTNLEKKTENTPESIKKKQRDEKLKQATGITENDITRILVSADLDKIPSMSNLQNTVDGTESGIDKVPILAAFCLSKKIDIIKLKAGIKIILDEQGDFAMVERKIADQDVIVAKSSITNSASSYFALDKSGRKILLTSNEETLTQYLTARKANAKASNVEKLIETEKNIPPSAQFRIAFVLSESMNKRMKAAIIDMQKETKNDPTAAMGINFLRPFQELKSVVVSGTMASNMILAAKCDLGNDMCANEAKDVLQSTLMMISMFTTQQQETGDQANFLNKIKLSSENQFLKVDLTANDADFEKLKEMQNDIMPMTGIDVSPANSKKSAPENRKGTAK